MSLSFSKLSNLKPTAEPTKNKGDRTAFMKNKRKKIIYMFQKKDNLKNDTRKKKGVTISKYNLSSQQMYQAITKDIDPNRISLLNSNKITKFNHPSVVYQSYQNLLSDLNTQGSDKQHPNHSPTLQPTQTGRKRTPSVSL